MSNKQCLLVSACLATVLTTTSDYTMYSQTNPQDCLQAEHAKAALLAKQAA
jgi:hypothetical protein